jgi:hypothetical protein
LGDEGRSGQLAPAVLTTLTEAKAKLGGSCPMQLLQAITEAIAALYIVVNRGETDYASMQIAEAYGEAEAL